MIDQKLNSKSQVENLTTKASGVATLLAKMLQSQTLNIIARGERMKNRSPIPIDRIACVARWLYNSGRTSMCDSRHSPHRILASEGHLYNPSYAIVGTEHEVKRRVPKT